MGLLQNHALGRNQRVYITDEVTPGTLVKPTGASALKILTSDIDWRQNRVSRDDSRQTRSLLERITQRKEATWSLEGYLLPSGTPATEPDIGTILTAAMGADNAGGGSIWVYSLSASQVLKTVSLVREMNAAVMEAALGAWVEQLTFSIPGGDLPKVSVEGGAFDVAHTGTSTLNGAPAGAVITVQAADADAFEVNSVVQVAADDNGGAGFRVISKTGAALTLEAAPTAVSTDPVVPFVPTEVTAGNPIAGITGQLDFTPSGLGLVTLPITSLELTVKQNVKAINDEAFQDKTTDLVPMFREVTGTFGLRARKDLIVQLARRKQFALHAIAVTVGSGAGTRVKFSLPTVELDATKLEVPEADEATFNLPFVALGASGEDEVTVTFD